MPVTTPTQRPRTSRAPLIAATLAVAGALLPHPAAAKNWVAGSGSWNTAANWSPAAVPVANEIVNIAPTDGVARTITYNVTAPSLNTLSIDLTGPGSAVTTFSMPSNFNLAANGILVGGYNGSAQTAGRAAVVQSAGTVSTNSGWDFVLGHGAGSTGTYSLSGTGTLTANQSEYIGLSGSGTFNHSAGTNNIATASGFFIMGLNATSTGTYNLSGTGSLVVQNSEIVGDTGSGTFNQTGGTHSINASYFLFLGNNAAGAGGTYNLSAGTLTSGSERIGYRSTGTFNQSGGTHTTANLQLGGLPGSTGTYSLSGTATLSPGTLYVGANASGTFNQTGGANNGSNLYVAAAAGSNGTYNLSAGSASFPTVVVGGLAQALPGGAASLTLSGNASLTSSTIEVVNAAPATALNLNGGTLNTASLNLNGAPARFNWTGGTLNLTSGIIWDGFASPTFTSAALGPNLVLGASRTLTVTGNESFSGGPFSITLNAGAAHTVTGTLTLGPSGTLTQNDGSSLYAGSIFQSGGAVNGTLQNQTTFTYQSGPFNGRLLNQGTLSFGTSFSPANGVQNDASITLNTGQTLTANGAGLDNRGTLTLAGGTLAGATLANSATLLLAAGTINAATSLTNDPGGILFVDRNARATVNGPLANAGEIQLGGDASTLTGSGTLTNAGLLRGDGTLAKPVTNDAAGEIRAEAGRRIKISGATTPNAGLINLQGGTAEFSLPLTNSPTGRIIGRGTLKTPALTNDGQLIPSAGFTDILGPVTNNSGSKVIVTGGATATFYDPVTNLPGSEFRVSAGSAAAFLAPVTGAGLFTGTGAKFFEAGASAPAFLATAGATTVYPAASLTTAYVRESSLAASGPTILTPGSPTSSLHSLAVSGTGSLDLTNNRLVLDFAAAPAVEAGLTQLRQYLLNSQVFSSTAAADPQHRLAIGYIDNALLNAATWGDLPVDATGILTNLTYLGDANLDGRLTADDFALVDRAFAKGTTNAHWTDGDFNYDGQVTSADYLLIDRTYALQGNPLSPSLLSERESQFGAAYVSQLLASVPEPSFPACLLTALPLLTRRRQR